MLIIAVSITSKNWKSSTCPSTRGFIKSCIFITMEYYSPIQKKEQVTWVACLNLKNQTQKEAEEARHQKSIPCMIPYIEVEEWGPTSKADGNCVPRPARWEGIITELNKDHASDKNHCIAGQSPKMACSPLHLQWCWFLCTVKLSQPYKAAQILLTHKSYFKSILKGNRKVLLENEKEIFSSYVYKVFCVFPDMHPELDMLAHIHKRRKCSSKYRKNSFWTKEMRNWI